MAEAGKGLSQRAIANPQGSREPSYKKNEVAFRDREFFAPRLLNDRLSAAGDAKKAQLERAARARSEAESPAAIERRMARDAARVARDARIAERKAAKLAAEARQAAALAAAQLAEAAAHEAALKAEQETRNAEFAERIAR